MKKLIRLSGVIVIVLCVLFSIGYINYNQFNHPLGTNAMFHISLADSEYSKEKIISDLNNIAIKNDSLFLLQSSTADDINEQRNIYVFGDKEIEPRLMAVQEDQIYWLFNQLEGKLIPSDNIKETPLSGNYYVNDNKAVENDLMEWSNKSGAIVNYYESKTALSFWRSQLSRNGAMIGLITSILLSISLVLSWVVYRSRTRCIQVLNGKSILSIHLELLQRVGRYIFSGVFFGAMLSLIYMYFTMNIKNIVLVSKVSLVILIISIVLILMGTLALSVIFKPTRDLISKREFPARKYYRSNIIMCFVAILLAVLTLTPSIKLMEIAYRNYNQTKELQAFNDAVSVSFNASDLLESQEGLKEFKKVLRNQPVNSLILNLDLGSVIKLSSSDLGGYEKILIVNDNFMDKIELKDGSLEKTSLKQLPESCSEFLRGQLEVSLNKDSNIEQSISLYTYKGNELMALGQNAFIGGEISYPNSALVIKIDNPVEKLDVSGFLFPVTSTGNLFFMDSNAIKNELESSSIYGGILSIDSVTSSAMTVSQDLALTGLQYLLSSIIVLFMIVFSTRQNVNVWAKANKKRNYILAINGNFFDKLYRKVLRKNIMMSCIIVILGAILTLVISRYSDIKNATFAVVITEAIYITSMYFFFRKGVRKEFEKAALREE
ncbi:MAG: hypothetical protein Q4P28_04565 [Tissierellia bacterium]|nr:hypothetical protein [Tissierellia bacterium]